jgi:hypothetical protein
MRVIGVGIENVMRYLLVLIPLLFPSIAEACSKIPDPDEKEYQTLIDASSVFRGLVTKIELVPDLTFVEDMPFVKIHVRSIEVLKGNVENETFVLTYTGYFGGCAVPALVGVEYLFAPEKSLLGNTTTDDLKKKELADESAGYVTIFQVAEVPQNPELVDEFMAEFRNWAKTNKD